MTAYPLVQAASEAIDADFLRQAIQASWVAPSVHWLFIAFLAYGLAAYKSKIAAAMLIGFGAMALTDAMLIFWHVGLFTGGIMLTASALCYLTAGFMLRREMYALLKAEVENS